jgi:hypothetical protein
MISSSLADVAAIALVVILTLLSVFQIALAAGAPLGQFAWGGQHRVLPTRQRVGSVASVVVYSVIAAIALQRSGQIALVPDPISRVGMWVVFGFFALSVVGNSLSRSRLERTAMVPTTALLAVFSLLVALA